MRIRTATNDWLEYDDAGQGQPVVLVHAFPLSQAMWRAQVEALRSEYRVITPDLRGFGGCDPFQGPPAIEAMGDDVRNLLDALGLAEPIVLGGLSMGGYVALAFARKYPERLRGLILADTRAEEDTPETKVNRNTLIELVKAQGVGPLVEQLMPKLLGEQTRQQRPGIVEEVRRIGQAQSVPGVVGALAAMRDRPDAGPWLGEIAVPTLVIVGSEDTVTPPSVADALAARIGNARKVIINGAGHLANLEQPEAVNDAVRSFLRGLA